jgi:putative transposon-encoded protein
MARGTVPVTETARVVVEGGEAIFEKTVTPFGNGAKVDGLSSTLAERSM